MVRGLAPFAALALAATAAPGFTLTPPAAMPRADSERAVAAAEKLAAKFQFDDLFVSSVTNSDVILAVMRYIAMTHREFDASKSTPPRQRLRMILSDLLRDNRQSIEPEVRVCVARQIYHSRMSAEALEAWLVIVEAGPGAQSLQWAIEQNVGTRSCYVAPLWDLVRPQQEALVAEAKGRSKD